MNTVKQIKEQIEEQNTITKELRDQLEAAKARQSMKCLCCEKRSKIVKWELFVKTYYVPPYGCTGGSYWTEAELAIKCPHCDVYHRPFGETNEKFVKEHRGIFKDGGRDESIPGRTVNWFSELMSTEYNFGH